MGFKKHIVLLSEIERSKLLKLVNTGRVAAHRRRHAQILLAADTGNNGPSLTDKEISLAVSVSLPTVQRIRKRCVEHGLESALERAKHSSYKPRKIDGDDEARLIALACSSAPEGSARWTLKLLHERYIALDDTDYVCKETIRTTLKKRIKTLEK